MLKIYHYDTLTDSAINELTRRNTDDGNEIRERVQDIIENVKSHGDAALFSYAERFDGVLLRELFIGKEEIQALAATIGPEQKQALEIAYRNIHAFHKGQLQQEEPVETMPGVTCWREIRAIERVGLYIPGGTAVLPSTFLMLGIPAKLAGCGEIVVCSPPQKNGMVNAFLAYCAVLLGIERVYLAGGAQAVAAMAYGTQSIPKVDKIFGPGNQYVTKAKTMVQGDTQTAIDMPAGPSEVLIIADETANPVFAAADLLAQAEHGADSQAILVSASADFVTDTLKEVEKQLRALPRAEIARMALNNSFAVIVSSADQAMEFSNRYAPEHLIIQTKYSRGLAKKVTSAGSVFIGSLTPESAGDYASGTNHTLPTSGYARSYSGVSVDSFVKKITFQEISEKGIKNIGPAVEILAELEGLQAHKNAVTVRLKKD
ncbi:histidinol dehydrogenase [Hufsiella ginkgonis]|uniref:Histidinol dehydrogenase n=1 Tax=Hufsiella ginkgonis TaxID=2695274 RepID=A0A7K1XVY4_9SPHI|nr:histidinol dehydrogenase [Hufsiella ginkgonis]MXV15142.1 histidinol dehydrogenase [Hufsiella ginkgonis]